MAHSNSILEPEVMLVFLLSYGVLNCKFACLSSGIAISSMPHPQSRAETLESG